MHIYSTDANRGNVAIIAWNTLQAAMWDVENTKLDGEVSLGTTGATLLNTYFRAYCENGKLKEIESATVEKVPSTDKEIGDRQIELNLAEAECNFDVEKAFEEEPKKNKEDATYKCIKDKKYNNKVVAYVAEEVYDDLEELLGREVTVIFGDDNEVALIIVEDDVVNNEYATKFDGEKLTIGETKYKFDKNFELYVNNVSRAQRADEAKLADELDNILRGTYSSSKTFEKNIKANVVLNAKGKVTRLDLYVSGNYPEYNTYETVVGKVKNTVIYDIDESTELYDYDDMDEDELPNVYVDGKKAAIEDIVPGDVLTIYYAGDNRTEYSTNKATTIYASRDIVEGAVTRIKNIKDIVIDGTTYSASVVLTKNVLLLDDTDFKNAAVVGESAPGELNSYKLRNLVDEDATLYTNIYGEYVLVASEASGTDYTFGIIKSFKEPEEEDNLYTQKVTIYVEGSSSYTVVYDDDDYEEDEDGYIDAPATSLLPDGVKAGTVIAFIANADKEIDSEDIVVVDNEDFNKYSVFNTGEVDNRITGIDFDNERITIGAGAKKGTYRFKSSSIIMNSKSDEDNSTAKPETLTWKGLVDDSNPAKIHDDDPGDSVDTPIIIVCEKDTTVISYIFVDMDDAAVSSADYAVVTDTVDADGKKTYAHLMDAEGNEISSLEDKKAVSNKYVNYIVEYKTSGSKLNSIFPLLDIDVVKDLLSNDEVAGLYAEDGEVKLLAEYIRENDNSVTSAQKTVCEKCDEATTHKATCDLYDNNAVETDEKTACEKCGEATTHDTACELYDDNAVETDEKTACAECGKADTHEGSCSKSGAVQTDEKTACEKCGEATTHDTTCELYDNNAVESAEKTACEKCGKATTHDTTCELYDNNAVESAEKTACATCGETTTHSADCTNYIVDTVAKLEAFVVDEAENTLLIYKDSEPIRIDAVNIPKDKSELTVFHVDTDGKVTVSSYNEINSGDVVFAFGTETEATLLVVID